MVHTIQEKIDSLGLSRVLNSNIPVDIEKVAKFLGADAVVRADIEGAGMLLPRGDGRFAILVNSRDSRARQRFSCAHEIAHAVLDSHDIANRSSLEQPKRSIERYCEKFASHLLMPAPAFDAYAQQRMASMNSIVDLADVFDVSIQAAALRYVETLSEPCILICSQFQLGRTGNRLRIKWSYETLARAEHNSKHFIPKGKSLKNQAMEVAYWTNSLQKSNDALDLGYRSIDAYSESMGFGSSNNRFVLSLVFPTNRGSTMVSES